MDSSHAVMRGIASAGDSPSIENEPSGVVEWTMRPAWFSVNAAFLTSPPLTTSVIGSPNVVANSQSRSSCPGTAMIAPVP